MIVVFYHIIVIARVRASVKGINLFLSHFGKGGDVACGFALGIGSQALGLDYLRGNIDRKSKGHDALEKAVRDAVAVKGVKHQGRERGIYAAKRRHKSEGNVTAPLCSANGESALVKEEDCGEEIRHLVDHLVGGVGGVDLLIEVEIAGVEGKEDNDGNAEGCLHHAVFLLDENGEEKCAHRQKCKQSRKDQQGSENGRAVVVHFLDKVNAHKEKGGGHDTCGNEGGCVVGFFDKIGLILV